MSPHTARHFHENLARLRTRLLEMSSMAEALVERAMEALAERDLEKAAGVVAGDRELDAVELEIDEACLNLLALQQPMARDLRFITMAMKISNDLERVGDHAVNIAEAVEHMAGQSRFARFPEIGEMATLARGMLSDALDHFMRSDADGAREVCARDDRVDALHETLFRTLLTHMMEDPRRIGPCISLLLVSRNLERIADLATNIAEDVVFLVAGRNIKHGAGRLQADRTSTGIAG
jgi:phosphate transport system protein